MKVSLDITLYKYPCSLLSLDVMDVLHSHTLNLEENITKTRIDRY